MAGSFLGCSHAVEDVSSEEKGVEMADELMDSRGLCSVAKSGDEETGLISDPVQEVNAAKDWMIDYAQDKEYQYDDGGSYYCMGKNDTCTNKTKNAYDLYCNSCDPDGDNVEG